MLLIEGNTHELHGRPLKSPPRCQAHPGAFVSARAQSAGPGWRHHRARIALVSTDLGLRAYPGPALLRETARVESFMCPCQRSLE